MAITQLNNYLPGQDLTNLADNVDYNRVGEDKTDITINHGTDPWTFTIKVGSLIEKDGNLYTVDTIDVTVQASSNAHNYIVFTGAAFASSANRGTYDPEKGGFYDSGNRVLKYYIDPDEDLEYTMVDNDSATEEVKISYALINEAFIEDGYFNSYDLATTSIIMLDEGVGTAAFGTEFTIKKPVSTYFVSGSSDWRIFQEIYDGTFVWINPDDDTDLTPNTTMFFMPGKYKFYNNNANTQDYILRLNTVYGHKDITVHQSDIFV